MRARETDSRHIALPHTQQDIIIKTVRLKKKSVKGSARNVCAPGTYAQTRAHSVIIIACQELDRPNCPVPHTHIPRLSFESVCLHYTFLVKIFQKQEPSGINQTKTKISSNLPFPPTIPLAFYSLFLRLVSSHVR